MNEEIAALEPQALWENFARLNAVPRPSKKEAQVQAFMRSFLEELGLDYVQDEIGNIIAQKPASPGYENRKKVVLQAHLDMVCQKNADTDFDFEKQGINMHIDGDWVKAQGTTLGADNGIGVAAIMAVLASSSIPHPPLEALFTTDEEAGMTGAHHLKPGALSGDILMNLDTEDDDELSIGCAGGIDTDISWSAHTQPMPAAAESWRIEVRGLQGGHSGMDIIHGRGNANKILTRLLVGLPEELGLQVQLIEGGSLRNAIPRESEAWVAVPQGQIEPLKAHWDQLIVDLKKEFATTAPNLQINYRKEDNPGAPLSSADSARLLWALQACPDGIRRLSPDVEDLVETSNNLARVQLKDGVLEAKCLTRSDRESAKHDHAQAVAAPFRLLGAKVEHSGAYPGWKLDPQAPMLAIMRDLYQELFSAEPRVIACHAGLECGLLGQHHPHLEMISFGPTIRDPHSPDEKVSIPSVQKFWHYFQEALKRIPAKAA